jgi:hypothetical protein
MTCWPASAVSVRLPPRTRQARSPMKSSWSGCGDCESFGSRPTPGSASTTRAPSPGRAQVPRPIGPFPAGGSNHPARRCKGTGTPRSGLGAPWLPEAWAWNGLGESTLAPLRQEVAAMKPHFNSLSLLTASNTIHDHKRRWDSECIGAVRLPNTEDVPVGCADGFGSQADGKWGEVRRRSRTCARKATTLAPLLRFVGARGFEPRNSSVSRNSRHAIYQHKRSLTCGDAFVVVRHELVVALCFAGFPRDGVQPSAFRSGSGQAPQRFGRGRQRHTPAKLDVLSIRPALTKACSSSATSVGPRLANEASPRHR